MFVYADFVAGFPEFSNTTTFPQSQVNFWIPYAYAELNNRRFGNQIDLAAMLWVAHQLALSARQQATAAAGGIPGAAVAPMSSKSVDKVSIGYDVGVASTEGAGILNTTVYGQRLLLMMKTYLRGPVYVAPQGGRFTL